MLWLLEASVSFRLELTLLSEQRHGRTAGSASSRNGFAAFGRGGRIVLTVDVTGAMLDRGDDRFDDHRVGRGFGGIPVEKSVN